MLKRLWFPELGNGVGIYDRCSTLVVMVVVVLVLVVVVVIVVAVVVTSLQAKYDSWPTAEFLPAYLLMCPIAHLLCQQFLVLLHIHSKFKLSNYYYSRAKHFVT